MFSRTFSLVAAALLIAAILSATARGDGAVSQDTVSTRPSPTDGVTIQHPTPLAVF